MPAERIGQYRVIERLGAGGMGHVYRAVDEMLGREAALKIIATPEEQATARLRSEAASLARLSHPGIATVYELIEDDGQLVLAMELVRGRTLQQILEQVGAFSPRQAADLCMQTLAVLEHAHAAGIVHRDLKPGNLMVTDSGVIKIMDFGIAHAHDSLGLTNAGAVIGTPAYMAPEQVLGQPIDARTDVYAMGVVLFRLVTAALPFKGETPFEMTQSQVNEAPAKATDVRPDLPAWVDEILARALAKQPADRFQSASEFQAALANAIAIEMPQPVATAAVEVTEVMVRPEMPPAPATRASRTTATWQTAAAVGALAAGIWFTTSGASPVRAPEPTPLSPAQIASVEAPVAIPVSTLPVAAPRKPAPKPAPSPTAEVPARAPVSFAGAKMIAVNGSRTSTSDVVLLLSDTEISIQSGDPSIAPTVLPYRGIVKATYAQGRDPKWDAGLSGPSGKVDVPGLGILSRTRHWLVLQGPDRYAILRLDGVDRADVMRAFEERAGIAIDRPSGVK